MTALEVWRKGKLYVKAGTGAADASFGGAADIDLGDY
jgi:hypothetical protein